MNSTQDTQEVHIYIDESTKKCRVQITGIRQYIRMANRKNFILIAVVEVPIQEYKRTHYFDFECEDPIKQMVEISGCRKLDKYRLNKQSATTEDSYGFVQVYQSTDPMYFCKLKFTKRIYKMLAKQTPTKIPIIGEQQQSAQSPPISFQKEDVSHLGESSLSNIEKINL